MWGFGNSEKSEIESEYREYTRGIPYNLPYNLKNDLTRYAEELKNKRMRVFEEKERHVDSKNRKVKEIERERSREEDRLESNYKQELKRLRESYQRKIDNEERQCERETSNVENSHSYDIRHAREKLQEIQKKIEQWERDSKK